MRTEPTARPLIASSIDVIVRGQATSGAFVAAPSYPTYAYSWLRDGSFIAAAMDACGQHQSAAAFHRWVAGTVERYATKVEALERAVANGLDVAESSGTRLDERYMLHTRFTLGGDEVQGEWGEFQLDGYGFWLTSLSRHLARTGSDTSPFRRAVDLVQRYLTMTWPLPCYDCWEEYPTERHTTTWAAVAQGLRASAWLANEATATGTADHIACRLDTLTGPIHVLRKFVAGSASAGSPPAMDQRSPAAPRAMAGHERMGRPLGPDAIDGSALLVIGTFGPFDPESAIVSATLQQVEDQLTVGGGVHRYLADEFYGGGLWVVLAGALAEAQAATDVARAREILAWIEQQADAEGALPEQVGTHLREPATRPAWLERWGLPARPLLWSHAMYLLGVAAVDEAPEPSPERRSAP